MLASSLLRLLTLSLIPSALAIDDRIEQPAGELIISKRQEGGAQSSPPDGESIGTTFNGKNVPPQLDLTGETLDDTIRQDYWLVEFFSPYCIHCKTFAPVWQTIYEFYYTSEPVPQAPGSGETANDLNSFTRYYNLRFARVDCVANADACNKKNIGNFPTLKLFKDGEPIKDWVGRKDLKSTSDLIEEQLEIIRPGSRPPGGPKLPNVGDDHVEKTIVSGIPSEPANDAQGVAGTLGSTTSISNVAGAAKPIPNENGKSIGLTAENFQRLVTTTHDPWFIKFYAPWCPHCQAMAPNWQGMARQAQGILNIGEVNCDVEKRLCKDVKVKGYPTILFFRGGERIAYDGLRGLGDLMDFANKAVSVADGVLDVNAAQFEELEKKEEVLFLYFYDRATTSEDFSALDRLVMSLIGHAKLVKTNDPLLSDRFKISTWPRLLVSRDGKPTYYTGLSPRDMRDFRRVLDWMQSVWLPIVPELTASNAREIMDGKLVVLGILSRDRPEEFDSAKREIKNAALEWIDKQTQAFKLERQELRDAKQLRIEEAEDRNDQRGLRAAKSIRINMDDIERKEVGFAWIDGVFWERWIRTTFGTSVLTDNERVVMYDYDNHRYWDNTMTGNPIVPSRTSILETLPRAVSNPPKISPKRTTTALGHIWWVLKGQLLEHPLVSIVMVLGSLIGFVVLARRHVRLHQLSAVGYFKVGEKGGPMDGLLGGNSGTGGQGKVD